MKNYRQLFTFARTALEKAYAPYSHFRVGAAIEADDGKVYAGCNVENASFPEGWCAETTAIGHLVMGGARRIVRAVVVASRIDGERVPGGRFCTPCGGCRQRLMEFAAPDTEIWAADPDGASQRFTMAELLPAGFVLEE